MSTMPLSAKKTKDLTINPIQEHENSKKYAKHLKALNEAQPTLAMNVNSEEVDQYRKNAEKRREAAAFFQEKGKSKAIVLSNLTLTVYT